jgi:hypothetical protein
VLARIGRFVEDYNDTYAVVPDDIIWRCWPQHPGLVRELATLYAQWVLAHEGGLATPELSAYWHDRWLPNFQKRVAERWFGTRKERCSATEHVAWRPAAKALADARRAPAAGAPTPDDALPLLRPPAAFTAPPEGDDPPAT